MQDYYPTYYPKISLKENFITKESIVFKFSLPLPDSLLHPDLYFKYGFTQFEKIPDGSKRLGELFHTIKALDSFKVLGHKNKTIKLETDSTSNFIGFIYDPLDSGYHGVEIINLTH
jgi:hypothetical protein